MDSHRKVSPDEFDGQAHEPEWGDSGPYSVSPAQPEPWNGFSPLDRPSPLADPGGSRPADGAAVLAMPLGPRPGEPQPAAPQAAAGPYVASASASVPPAYAQEPYTPAYVPESPTAVHAAPTSGLPHLAGDAVSQPAVSQPAVSQSAASQPAGRSPLAGDPRPVSGGSGWSGGDSAEETQAMRRSTEALDRSALRRPSGGSGQLGDGVYRSKRPAMAVAIAAATVIFELIALRLLTAAFFASNVQVGNSIASSFLVVGLPMFGVGLYELLRGAATAPGSSVRAWLRPPLVYLPVALVLFVTAGLAAS